MKVIGFFGCLFVLLLVFDNAHAELTMATGARDGSYYPVGKAIADLLGEDMPVSVKESEGSVENISKLLAKECDLAIVQSDILHRENKSEIMSLLALYPEYIQILVRKKSDIHSFWKLNGKNLYIGLAKSGTHHNASHILEVLGIDYNEVVSIDDLESDSASDLAGNTLHLPDAGEKNLTTSTALDLLREGHLDAVFSTSGKIIKDEDLRHLEVDDELASDLKQESEYYSLTRIKVPGEGEIPLLFTRANLVARAPESPQGLSGQDAKDIVKKIHENQRDLRKHISDDLDLFSGDRLVRRITHNIHPGAEEYFQSQNMLPHIRFWEYIIIAMSGFVGITIIFARVLRNSGFVTGLLQIRPVVYFYAQSWFKTTWDFFLKITCATAPRILTWLFAITFVGAIYFIQFLEKEHSIANDVENPLSGIEFFDGAVWLLTFAITGFNQDIYPNTPTARILAVLVPIFGILLTFFILVRTTFSADREAERQAQGISIPRLKNHILICGWNDRVPNLLRDLVSSASPLPPNGRVVVIAEHDKEKPLEDLGLEGKRSAYVRGRSSNYEILRKVGIERALGAIVVAGQNKIADNNYRSILTCMAIRDNLGPLSNDFPIIAELYYEKNKQLFESSGVDKLVSLKNVSVRMVSHAALNPGISQLVLHLLKFSTSQVPCRIQVTELEKHKPFKIADRTFAEVLKDLREHGILLLAVYEQDKERESDKKAVELEFRENSPYHFGTETDYRIKPENLLIILQRNKKAASIDKTFLRSQTPGKFDYSTEVVLLIGNDTTGKEIAEILSERAEKVILLIPHSTEKNRSNVGKAQGDPNLNQGYKVLQTEQQLDVQFFSEHRDELSNVTRAVILGPDRQGAETKSEVFQDDQTIMYAKLLRNIAEKRNFCNDRRLHILAEMRCDENLDLFRHSEIDQPVPTNMLIEQCLAQMVFNRGIISELFLKAMSYSDSNKKGRLERVSAAKLSKFVKQEVYHFNYDELIRRCIDSKVQVIAIQPAGSTEFEQQLIVNPTDSKEKSYELGQNDFVFVFNSPESEGLAIEEGS